MATLVVAVLRPLRKRQRFHSTQNRLYFSGFVGSGTGTAFTATTLLYAAAVEELDEKLS